MDQNCPTCGGQLEVLGQLGNLYRLRCRHCGQMTTDTWELDPWDDGPTEDELAAEAEGYVDLGTHYEKVLPNPWDATKPGLTLRLEKLF